jgi:hypothetical protein
LRVLLRKRTKVGLVGLVVAGGAVAAFALGPAGLAVGQSSPPVQAQIQVNSPATLGANGASVDVSVTAGCSANAEPPLLVVEIVENVKGNIALGYGESAPSCTGTSQTFDVLVTAGDTSPSGMSVGPSVPFAKGVAIANASISACTPDGSTCASQQVQPVITIKK